MFGFILYGSVLFLTLYEVYKILLIDRTVFYQNEFLLMREKVNIVNSTKCNDVDYRYKLEEAFNLSDFSKKRFKIDLFYMVLTFIFILSFKIPYVITGVYLFVLSIILCRLHMEGKKLGIIIDSLLSIIPFIYLLVNPLIAFS